MVGRMTVERELDSERDAGWRAEPRLRAATGRNRPRPRDRRVRPGLDCTNYISGRGPGAHLATHRRSPHLLVHSAAGTRAAVGREGYRTARFPTGRQVEREGQREEGK
jgi:hypothetical protein